MVFMTVWTVLSDVFRQKMSHRKQGVFVTSSLSMHVIVTSFSFTLIHIHTNTPITQSVHVLLKLTIDKSDMLKSNYVGNRIASYAIMYVNGHGKKHRVLLNTADRHREY